MRPGTLALAASLVFLPSALLANAPEEPVLQGDVVPEETPAVQNVEVQEFEPLEGIDTATSLVIQTANGTQQGERIVLVNFCSSEHDVCLEVPEKLKLAAEKSGEKVLVLSVDLEKHPGLVNQKVTQLIPETQIFLFERDTKDVELVLTIVKSLEDSENISDFLKYFGALMRGEDPGPFPVELKAPKGPVLTT